MLDMKRFRYECATKIAAFAVLCLFSCFILLFSMHFLKIFEILVNFDYIDYKKTGFSQTTSIENCQNQIQLNISKIF